MTVELFNLYADRLRPLFRIKGPLDQLDQAVTHGMDRPRDREMVERAIRRAEAAIVKGAKALTPPQTTP